MFKSATHLIVFYKEICPTFLYYKCMQQVARIQLVSRFSPHSIKASGKKKQQDTKKALAN